MLITLSLILFSFVALIIIFMPLFHFRYAFNISFSFISFFFDIILRCHALPIFFISHLHIFRPFSFLITLSFSFIVSHCSFRLLRIAIRFRFRRLFISDIITRYLELLLAFSLFIFLFL